MHCQELIEIYEDKVQPKRESASQNQWGKNCIRKNIKATFYLGG